MKALITGASSGLGYDFAKELSKQGYDLVIVARSLDKLNKLKDSLKTNVEIVAMDLGVEENVYKLYDMYKGQIDLLINNAGFGSHGCFNETDVHDDVDMINLNVTAVHILTKLFLTDFESRNQGQILNVSSLAGFLPAGPLMATYYATKAYVRSLTLGIYGELKKKKSNVKISCLCPGPVRTSFMDRANVNFTFGHCESEDVVKYTLAKLKKNKTIIIPGLVNKLSLFACRVLPTKLIVKICYGIQKSKTKK